MTFDEEMEVLRSRCEAYQDLEDRSLPGSVSLRWDLLSSIPLNDGPNLERSLEGMSPTELFAYATHQEHTHFPRGMSFILMQFVDALSSYLAEIRDFIIRPYLPQLLHTQSDTLDRVRLLALSSHLFRVCVPEHLEFYGFGSDTNQFRELTPFVTRLELRKANARISGFLRKMRTEKTNAKTWVLKASELVGDIMLLLSGTHLTLNQEESYSEHYIDISHVVEGLMSLFFSYGSTKDRSDKGREVFVLLGSITRPEMRDIDTMGSYYEDGE